MRRPNLIMSGSAAISWLSLGRSRLTDLLLVGYNLHDVPFAAE